MHTPQVGSTRHHIAVHALDGDADSYVPELGGLSSPHPTSPLTLNDNDNDDDDDSTNVTQTLLGTSLSSPGSDNPTASAEDVPLPCFCLDLARLSPELRFVVLTIGVSLFFLLNSWVEEYTFKRLPHFHYGWYV